MSKVQILRSLVQQRLCAAAEEICELFERTIAEYEEERSRSEEKEKPQEEDLHPEEDSQGPDAKLQQERNSGLDQENLPVILTIKSEEDKPWISEGRGQEETDMGMFTFSAVFKESDDGDGGEPQSFQLDEDQSEENRDAEHLETEADGEDCGGPECPDVKQQQERNSDLNQENLPVSLNIKSEEEKPWISEDRGQEEADMGMFTFSAVFEESDDGDGGEPQSFQLDEDQSKENRDAEHLETEPDGEDCGGQESPDVKQQQQEKNSGLNQENLPVSLTIKTEEEKPWISVKRNEKKADMSTFMFSEDGGEPQSFLLVEDQSEENREAGHLETEADGEDCGDPEPDTDLNPHSHSVSPHKTSDSSGSDTEDSSDWGERDEPQKGSKPLQKKAEAVGDMKRKTRNKPVRSSVCAPSFVQTNQQQRHKVRKRAKRFSCSLCVKKFTSKRGLDEHKLRHSKIAPLNCSFCGKGFYRKAELEMHMNIHTGQRPFTCSVCGKKYPSERNLRIHMLRHASEKPYSCSVCKRGFIRKAEMLVHMGIHAKKKPLSCSVCGKTFLHQGNLNKHSIVHTREKQHICSVCGKGFITRGLLDRHSVIHSGETQFSCTVCSKKFTYQKSFIKHNCDGRNK